jgi:hypothetical protein
MRNPGFDAVGVSLSISIEIADGFAKTPARRKGGYLPAGMYWLKMPGVNGDVRKIFIE